MYNKTFEEALRSQEASFIRGKLGIARGNKLIQDTYNIINKTHYSGFDYEADISHKFR